MRLIINGLLYFRICPAMHSKLNFDFTHMQTLEKMQPYKDCHKSLALKVRWFFWTWEIGCFPKTKMSFLANQSTVYSGGVALDGSATNRVTWSFFNGFP